MKNGIALSVAAMVLSIGAANATENVAGGTLNFAGSVTDATCTINGGNSASMSIVLDPISVTQAGTTEGLINDGKKAFSLEFSNCQSVASGFDPATSLLKLQFSSANTISNDGKYLINQELNSQGNAKNVGIAIVKQNAETTPIALNQVFDTGVSGTGTTPDSVDFYAKYYKVGTNAAEAGQVTTMVTYNVTYM
ncbi:fimbrial protein [Klebsiella aerogenes]|uniref:fimbrial protein n=1 Tax=Klebsiella aerogenes TaxID=548 RepID=UPI0032DA2409